ncbi:MAG TPA: NUDIX hydrolase, partial [Candidatus Saccharimonadales bacterium]|nr:NUDIX hydrolase [Candidatus Saccharimonadales bacterium]
MLTSIYGVFLNAEGLVLLVKDAHSQVWGFPGGGVEAGETHDEAVRREFLEETGMSIVGEVVYITDQDDASKQRRFYKIAQVSGVLRKGG